MKYHALFVIFENCRLLQIIGGALRINPNHKILVLLILTMYDKTKKCVSMK